MTYTYIQTYTTQTYTNTPYTQIYTIDSHIYTTQIYINTHTPHRPMLKPSQNTHHTQKCHTDLHKHHTTHTTDIYHPDPCIHTNTAQDNIYTIYTHTCIPCAYHTNTVHHCSAGPPSPDGEGSQPCLPSSAHHLDLNRPTQFPQGALQLGSDPGLTLTPLS